MGIPKIFILLDIAAQRPSVKGACTLVNDPKNILPIIRVIPPYHQPPAGVVGCANFVLAIIWYSMKFINRVVPNSFIDVRPG
jgi:hypothetical protein